MVLVRGGCDGDGDGDGRGEPLKLMREPEIIADHATDSLHFWADTAAWICLDIAILAEARAIMSIDGKST